MHRFVLSDDQQDQLAALVQHPPTARHLKRAQAVLWVAQGESITDVAARLQVRRQSIYHWLARLHGRDGALLQQLTDAPGRGRTRRKGTVLDQVLPAVLPTSPEAHGYRATGWTNALLRRYLWDHHQLRVARVTLQAALHRAGYRWKRPRYVTARRSPTWRQAKGGSNGISMTDPAP